MKNKVFPKENEDRAKDTIKKLKSQIKRLQKQNDNLKSENRQLRECFDKNLKQVQNLSESYSLEELVEKAKTPTEKLREEMRSIYGGKEKAE